MTPCYQSPTGQCQRTAPCEVACDLRVQPRQLVSVSSIDVEKLIAACVPGGNLCDPQEVADNMLKAEELMREMADLLAAVLGNFTRDDDLPDNLLPRIHAVLYRT